MRQAALDARHSVGEAFAIVVKSYPPDLPYVQRLLESFRTHNVDEIPLFLVVPDDALDLFGELVAPLVTLLGESTFADHLIQEPLNGYDPGYINQEIVKLAFWETGLADNYLCLDSDAEFVRDFHRSDFMADEITPYTFLTEDRALLADPQYYQEHWVHRQPQIERIAAEIGLSGEPLRTVHGHAVFSATVLRAFWDRFLSPRGWAYADALRLAPYEPTWYSFWLLKDQTIPIVAREPIIKTFHSAIDYLEYSVRGVTLEDVSRAYVGVVINSNFSRGDGLLSLSDPSHLAIARYRSTAEILRSVLPARWRR